MGKSKKEGLEMTKLDKIMFAGLVLVLVAIGIIAVAVMNALVPPVLGM